MALLGRMCAKLASLYHIEECGGAGRLGEELGGRYQGLLSSLAPRERGLKVGVEGCQKWEEEVGQFSDWLAVLEAREDGEGVLREQLVEGDREAGRAGSLPHNNI